MPYSDPKKRKEAARKAMEKKRKGLTKGLTNVNPDPVNPSDVNPKSDQNVNPVEQPVKQLSPLEAYKEARYRAYKEGHLHEFRG